MQRTIDVDLRNLFCCSSSSSIFLKNRLQYNMCMQNLSFVTVHIITLPRFCSLAFNMIRCNSSKLARTNGGIGLQQAKIPCISRGNDSDICSNIWLGSTYLKQQIIDSICKTIRLKIIPDAFIFFSRHYISPSVQFFQSINLSIIEYSFTFPIKIHVTIVTKYRFEVPLKTKRIISNSK